MIYYQIGAVVIVLLFILIGAFRGIIRSLLNLIGLALNAFLSYWIARPLAQGIYDTFVKQALIEKVQAAIAQHGVNYAVDNALGSMPDWLANAVGLSEKLSGQNFEQLVKGYELSNDQTLSMAQAVEKVIGIYTVYDTDDNNKNPYQTYNKSYRRSGTQNDRPGFGSCLRRC